MYKQAAGINEHGKAQAFFPVPTALKSEQNQSPGLVLGTVSLRAVDSRLHGFLGIFQETVNHSTVLFFGGSTGLAVFSPLRGNLIPICSSKLAFPS